MREAAVRAGGPSVVEVYSSKFEGKLGDHDVTLDPASIEPDNKPFVRVNVTPVDGELLLLAFQIDDISFQMAHVDQKHLPISSVRADVILAANSTSFRVNITDGSLDFHHVAMNGTDRTISISKIPPSPALNRSYDIWSAPWTTVSSRSVLNGYFSVSLTLSVESIAFVVGVSTLTVDVDSVRLQCVLEEEEAAVSPSPSNITGVTFVPSGTGSVVTVPASSSSSAASTTARPTTTTRGRVDTVVKQTTAKLQPDTRFRETGEIPREDPLDGDPKTAPLFTVDPEPHTAVLEPSASSNSTGTGATVVSTTTTVTEPTTTIENSANPVLDVPPESGENVDLIDAIGVGGFIGIGVGACVLISLLIGVGVFCALRNKQKTVDAGSHDMQSARNENEEVTHNAASEGEYVAPPKFTLNEDYGVGRLDTQI